MARKLGLQYIRGITFMIKNKRINGITPKERYNNGKRVVRTYNNGIIVWDVSGGFEIVYNNPNGGIYSIGLSCNFGKDITVNWGTNYGGDKETITDGSTATHTMVWLDNGIPAQYHEFTVSIDTDVDLVPSNFAQDGKYYITSVTLPDSIMSIGSNAFDGCNTLVNINLPQKLEYMEMNALSNCNLGKIVIPNSVKTIGMYAFYNNQKLSDVDFGAGLKNIGMSAFRKCNIVDLLIPDSVTSIGDGAFGDNYNLKNVTIGNSCKSIDSNAFENDNSIESFKIGIGVETMGISILEDNPNLHYIEYGGTIEQWENINFLGCPFWDNNAERYINCIDGNIILPDVMTRQATSWKY